MSPTASRNILLMLLCMTSGIVDVIGYLGLGHIFTANMTGNIVMLGLAIGHAQGLAVIRSVIALIGFVAGVALAASIVGRNKEKMFWPSTVTVALSIEGLILIVCDLISGPTVTNFMVYVLIALLSIAMGMQTTAARRLGIAGISTTVLTNNLANVVEDLMGQLRRLLNRDQTVKPFSTDSILRASAVFIYCFGAIAAAIAEQRYPFAIMWVPVCMIGGIIFIVLTRFKPNLSKQN